ncbi:hemimethylated DNA binding domain-containing protein [Cryptosporidium serpentis]
MRIIGLLLLLVFLIYYTYIECSEKYRTNFHQYTALLRQSENVIKLDFSQSAEYVYKTIIKNRTMNEENLTRFMYITISNIGFLCLLPENNFTEVSKAELNDVKDPINNSMYMPLENWNKISYNEDWGNLDENTKYYIKMAKVKWLMNRCYSFTDKVHNDKNMTQTDIYEICIGQNIQLKRINSSKVNNVNFIDTKIHLIGDYVPNYDILGVNGTLIQFYYPKNVPSSLNIIRKGRIQFVCSEFSPGILSVYEDNIPIHKYSKVNSLLIETTVVFGAPSFCDWRLHADIYRKNNTLFGYSIQDNNIPKLSNLLLPLQGHCQNFTDSNLLSYEVCNFESVIQYKKNGSDIVHPMYFIGTNDIEISPDFPKELKYGKIKTLTPNSSSIYPNMTVKLEPYNIHDYSNKKDIPSKYVLVVELKNGNPCFKTNHQRYTRLIYECPDEFHQYTAGYFRVVNIIENPICVYEVLIQTPVICSHPLLMPVPIMNSSRITYCYPQKKNKSNLKFNAQDVLFTSNNSQNMSILKSYDKKSQTYNKKDYLNENGIPIINNNTHIQDVEDIVTINQSNDLEAVPSIYITSFLNQQDTTQSYFSTSLKSRIRKDNNYKNKPLYYLGQLVKHRWWNYHGVIIGWDWSVQAPKQWIDKVYQKYSANDKLTPHYLMLVHQDYSVSSKDFVSTPNNIPRFLFAYIPQIGLDLLEIKGDFIKNTSEIINNPYFSFFFSKWDINQNRFLPNQGSILWLQYPDDLKLLFKDEL